MDTEAVTTDAGRADAARHTERLAETLRSTADRLDRYAGQLRNADSTAPAASIVADVLSDYEQSGAGPIIWQLVIALRDAR